MNLNRVGISKVQIRKYGIELTTQIYSKCNHQCLNCGTSVDLAIHHIDDKGTAYVKKGLKPNNDPNNLILLCRKCHKLHHLREYWDKKIQENGGYLKKGKDQEYQRKWFANHPAKQAEYCEKHRERRIAYSREFYANNKKYFHDYYLKRKARMKILEEE